MAVRKNITTLRKRCAKAPFGSFQQHRSSIGTTLPLIEFHPDRLGKISANNKHSVAVESVKRKSPLVP
jgi:hypothetical protein